MPLVLDTSAGDLVQDFFSPLLSNSLEYRRAVGYFSSGWLRINTQGMVAFANNGGKARWVTSPILDQHDWDALLLGDMARSDPVLHRILQKNISDLSRLLEVDVLSALAWMVADGILTFKLALPYNKLERGNFHDKFGIFTDSDGNYISFNGSYNDSIQGIRNYESIKIFSSWDPAALRFVTLDIERFERLWNNSDENVRVFDLPDAAREQILSLRVSPRPYGEPLWVRQHQNNVNSTAVPPGPSIPLQLILRDYQLEAIECWFASDCKGLLEMATGTGKTITALAASVRLFKQTQRLAIVITVPFQHLVDQWNSEARQFGYRPILAFKSKRSWLDELNSAIIEFNSGYRNVLSVITTYSTLNSQDFQASLMRLAGPAMLIADEAHHLGAEGSRHNYPTTTNYRLALSATPDRWFDAEGTYALKDYFGETVFAFPLERAIGISLTPYYYYPHLVALADDELVRYEQLSQKIGKLSGRTDDEGQEILKLLLIQRADVLNNAANKLHELSTLVDIQHLDHTLFYCAPGQIDEVMRLLGWDKGLLVQRFTAEESSSERKRILADFAIGLLQGLVAMKCLDEGVDVPSAHTAFLLASSSNPREFIQRRGRILRKAPGKEFSVIHDLIAVPPQAWSPSRGTLAFRAERSIVRRELGRFKEFASPSLNKHEALDVVWDIARRYGLIDF